MQPTRSVALASGNGGAGWALTIAWAAFLASVAMLIVVAVDGPRSAVAEASDGDAAFGVVFDRLSTVVLVLVTAINLVVQQFAARYLRDDPRRSRFFAWSLVLLIGTALVSTAATFSLLVGAWIVVSAAVCALLAHRRDLADASDGVRRTARAFAIGDGALVIALIVLLATVGDLDLRTLSSDTVAGETIEPLALSVAATVGILIVIAALARSANYPLPRWLPSTLAAPTPVSALLHAGVVNAGGILLIRLSPVLDDAPVATHLALAAGLLTATLGSLAMIVRADRKGGLAQSTVAQMGFMIAQCSVGAFGAAAFHLIAHSMYKASLFLGAGGAITQHVHHDDHRPTGPAPALVSRLAATLALPAIALGIVIVVFDPYLLEHRGGWLVVGFAWVTGAHATWGWLRRGIDGRSLGIAALATLVASAAYLLGASLLDRFLDPALAEPGGGFASPWWVAAVAVVAAAVALTLALPGSAALRSRLWLRVVDIAHPLSLRAVPAPDAPTPPRTPVRTTATDRTELRVDVEVAAEVIAPMWPLRSFIAVNPLDGLRSDGFASASATAHRWLHATTLPSTDYFAEAYAAGRITDADLRAAGLDGPPGPPTDAAQTQPHRTIGERCDALLGTDIAPAADDIVARWCALYVDDAESTWKMPDRDLGFYAAWRSLAADDPVLQRIAGPVAVDQLPERADDAVLDALDAVGIGEDVRRGELRGQLSRLVGWASYARWRQQWASIAGGEERTIPFEMLDLIAVRLTVERLLVTRALGSDVVNLLAPATTDAPDDPATESANDIWLRAFEGHYRDALLTELDTVDRSAPERPRPVSQVVFCIDVRSEGFRRHLESVADHETIGFAGFFAIFVSYRPLGSVNAKAQCPVLVSPAVSIAERPAAGAEREAERTIARWHDEDAAGSAFHSAKVGAGSAFGLAEMSGWINGPVAAARTMRPPRRNGPDTRQRLPTEPIVFVDQAGDEPRLGYTIEEATLYTQTALTLMGLTTNFARLVLLCGHGGRTVNNPHASSLDCGACGGNPGGDNARIAAAMFNHAEVRAGLRERGIDIPDDTFFVAGEHDTTTDAVAILDHELVPESHHADLDRLAADLAAAGELNAAERITKLPGGKGDAVEAITRANDWAEVQPEWALAANAAFVAGPRTMTDRLDLGHRVFLHNYDAEIDGDAAALETIMTAPLVVAHWINTQYYFSTVDPDVFGGGDKTLHNPVGGLGVLVGNGGDLRIGLPQQSVMVGDRPYHEPMRLLAVIEAPLQRITEVIDRNPILRDLFDGEWLYLAARERAGEAWHLRRVGGAWEPWQPASSMTNSKETETADVH